MLPNSIRLLEKVGLYISYILIGEFRKAMSAFEITRDLISEFVLLISLLRLEEYQVCTVTKLNLLSTLIE